MEARSRPTTTARSRISPLTAPTATPISPNRQQAVPARPATKERSTRLNLKLAPAVHAMVQEVRGTPERWPAPLATTAQRLSLIHISEPTRLRRISYAVFCLKKKKNSEASALAHRQA